MRNTGFLQAIRQAEENGCEKGDPCQYQNRIYHSGRYKVRAVRAVLEEVEK